MTFTDAPDVDAVADARGVVEVELPHGRLRGHATLNDGTELPFDLVNAPGLRRVRVALSGNEEAMEDTVLASAMPSGRYEPLAVLGSGAMGRVIKARDTQLDRLVAIKLLRGDMVATEEDRQFFVTEGRSLARLKHPHLLAVYDLGVNDGAPYLVVEYVDGPDLEKVVLTNGPLPWRSICAAGVQIGQALDALHQAALVHRDVKPSNGLVDATGHVVLADFGLVKPLGDLADPRSRIFGTPAYMSPEHLQGLGLGPATDVYSLGATLHHLAAGATPFTGASMIVDIVRKSPPSLKKTREDVPQAIAELVLACMAKSPEDRPSASEVVERFAAIEAELPDEPIGPFLPRSDRRVTTGPRVPRTESGGTEIRTPVASVAPTLDSEPQPVTALHPAANETEAAGSPSDAQAVAASDDVSTSTAFVVPGARRRWAVIAAASAALGVAGVFAFALTRPPAEPALPPTPVPTEASDAPAPEPTASPSVPAEPDDAGATPALEGTGTPTLAAVPLPDEIPSPIEGSATPPDPSEDPAEERAAVEPPPRDRADEDRSERRDEEREEDRRDEEPETDRTPPETADEGEVETAARTAPEPEASGDGVGQDAASEAGPGTDEDTSPPVEPEAAPARAEPVATPPVAAPIVEPVPVAPTPTPEAPALTAPTDEDDDGSEGRRRRGDPEEPTEPREREPPVPPMGF